ncbi:hypothetical protein H112_02400 [Trichophyton rubrum D6]|uniref:Uncharacterized protein n=3 Tax=Trichophyton TaxID=5550 RepID=F2SUL8_TRIRC|nr:uncharacterized protein TERG_06167 [Trichophyton rubrum CBS 118892]EZF25257.1 hypothetical protein H100_02401 [Trichophyton rubrum MR850]EZF44267.1 hypothetical protein H102_02398 [Trichophyton rubrum CBS 100081]EZF54906.1 hypothetical protein H103_02410 [Trichophyton rubrum CBS 288.86]EZF65539.1 hypothetical protein H104_02385 [Trichophyton rubrum CBS 289.86]EZF76166.1 hypothetical protein H105_02419 [Trichophyton soudanense CBS 452.61]EZF86816.1 hypothetical protein H110_02404 [Trichophy
MAWRYPDRDKCPFLFSTSSLLFFFFYSSRLRLRLWLPRLPHSSNARECTSRWRTPQENDNSRIPAVALMPVRSPCAGSSLKEPLSRSTRSTAERYIVSTVVPVGVWCLPQRQRQRGCYTCSRQICSLTSLCTEYSPCLSSSYRVRSAALLCVD